MTAALETGLYHKTPAWHKLGVVVDNEITSTEEAIKTSGLDWTVEPKPIYNKVTHSDGTSEFVPIKGKMAGVRSTDDAVLGINSTRFCYLQNADAFKFFDPVLREGICAIDSCGSLRGGKTIWILTKLASGMVDVVKDDPIQNYLLLANSHDGSISVTVCPTTVRVVCQNTLSIAINEAVKKQKRSKDVSIIRIRHSASLEEKLEEARGLINFQTMQFQKQLDRYQYLASKEMTTSQFRTMLTDMFSTELQQVHDRKMKSEGSDYDGVVELEDLRATKLILRNFDNSEDLQTANVRGTAWAAYNAITEFVSHQKSSNMDSRMNSIWFGNDKNLLIETERRLLDEVVYART